MKKILKRFKNEQDGAIALEACLSLVLFLIAMLALYSMLKMFTIQSMIAHALQESCQSIALENYNQSALATDTLQQIPNALWQLVLGNGFNSGFHTSADYSIGNFFKLDDEKEQAVLLTTAQATAKKRFAAYLAGGETEADSLLKNYGVVDGLNGIYFDGTEKGSKDLAIQVTYRVRLMFYIEALDFGEYLSTQKVCCRLWS